MILKAIIYSNAASFFLSSISLELTFISQELTLCQINPAFHRTRGISGGLKIPSSVIIAVTSSIGVASKAGL